LVFFTDPARTPDTRGVIARLPRGAGVVYRAFGDKGATLEGRELVRLAHTRGVVLLAGADPGLAAAIGADGVHLPERMLGRARALHRARPTWIVTCAAHSAAALAAARRAGADAAFLSPVFESRSPSAARPIGALRFTALVRGAGLPVYALGGVGVRTVRRLARSGAAGLAAVEGLVG
jgi:thiamine-phosphate pyrophosphorylase